MLTRIFCCLIFLCSSYQSKAQTDTTFSTRAYIDVNNIKAVHLLHGDMWFDNALGANDCEYPKGSGVHISQVGALWLAGYDGQGQLRVAAQTYRQDGNDYWPGPLYSSSPISHSESERWAKIWKVNRAEINTFLAIQVHTLYNTPIPILEWPAKGNPYARGNNNVALTVTKEMAPFVDVHQDGLYDALSGDYPLMKGDQMLWSIFNDNGPTHTQSDTDPLELEISSSVYAYQRGSPIDNVLFYEYKIHNVGSTPLDSFVLGLFNKTELGFSGDDYIGYDSTRNLGYAYNGTIYDGFPTSGYADSIPMVGLKLLKSPNDTCGQTTDAGSFMYYRNNNSVVNGNPATAADFNGYLRHRWRNGQPLTNDYQGPGISSDGTAAGPEVKYVFSGDPSDSGTWSECGSGNFPSDRRMVLSTAGVTLSPSEVVTVAFALLASPRSLNNGCPNVDLAALQEVADTAQKIFCDPLPNNNLLSVPGVTHASGKLRLYPNPAKDQLTVEQKMDRADVTVYDALGRRLQVPAVTKGNATVLDVAALPSGVYHIVCEGDERLSASFVKE